MGFIASAAAGVMVLREPGADFFARGADDDRSIYTIGIQEALLRVPCLLSANGIYV
jgi:hypothetical protein